MSKIRKVSNLGKKKVSHRVEKMRHILLRKELAAHQKNRYPSCKKCCSPNQEKH